MNRVLIAVFKKLNQENIRYCVLRDYEALDQCAEAGDVDLLIEADQLKPVRSLLARLGFAAWPRRGHEPHHFFMIYDEDSDRWLKLDIVTEIAFGARVHALRTALAQSCLNNRQRCGDMYIPSPEDELVTLLLHCVLDKKAFTPERRRQLKALRHQVSETDYVATLLAAYWSPAMTWPRLAHLIDREAWTTLLQGRRQVAIHLTSRDWPGTAYRLATRVAQRKLDRWVGLLQPHAPAVAVLAPDGAGKSTLAASLQASFHLPVRAIYMGLYQKPATPGIRRRIPGVGIASRLLTQWKRYLVARYHQARGRLVIFDRYTYDALLPASGNTLSRPRRLRRWLLAHACPAPDFVLVLDAPGDVLYHRKREHSPEKLEAQRQRYLELQTHLPHAVVIDATQDIDDVRRRATALIWHSFTLRNRGRMT